MDSRVSISVVLEEPPLLAGARGSSNNAPCPTVRLICGLRVGGRQVAPEASPSFHSRSWDRLSEKSSFVKSCILMIVLAGVSCSGDSDEDSDFWGMDSQRKPELCAG